MTASATHASPASDSRQRFDSFSLNILAMGAEELSRYLHEECLPANSLLEFAATGHGAASFDLLADAEHHSVEVDGHAPPAVDLRLSGLADGSLKVTTTRIMTLPEVDMDFARREYNAAIELIGHTAALQDREQLTRFMKEQFWMVRSLDRALRGRYTTMRRVVQHAVELQADWFRRGREYQRPLTRKGVAAELGLCPTTVERAVRNKHLATPDYGVLPVAALFPACLTTRDGRAVPRSVVQRQVRRLLANENQTRPLSDAALTRALADGGYDFPRRTVSSFLRRCSILPFTQRRAEYFSRGGSRA